MTQYQNISIKVQSVGCSSKRFELLLNEKVDKKLTFVGFLEVRHIFWHFPIIYPPFYQPHQTTTSIRDCPLQPFEYHPNQPTKSVRRPNV